jgi:hypothetical protein
MRAANSYIHSNRQMLNTVAYYGTLAIESLVGVFGVRLYEEPHYEVIDRIGDRTEVRRYASRLAAEAAPGTPGEAGRQDAFRLLFAYIAGANRATAGSAKIAMTVPVAVRGSERIAMTVPVQTAATDGAVRMQFFLPGKYSIDTAPQPMDAHVRLVTIPEQTIAALRFSGSGSDAVQRMAELKSSRWRPVEEPFVLYYDAPFTLPFRRRNEAAVVVTAGH